VFPQRKTAALALLIALFAAAAGAMPALRLPLFAVDALLVAAMVADALLLRGRRIAASREVASILSVGRKNAVVITLRNDSGRVLRGVVSDDPVSNSETTGLPAPVVLLPRATIAVRYEVTPSRRGPRTFGAVAVRYGSPLGLIARQERIALPSQSDVYPDVHASRALELLRRQGRQDARLGSLRVRGGDTEFERLRPYQVGDEVRHIDWRSSARRDDPTVRQFQAESNQNVVFAIDVGRGMRGASHGLEQVDHALNAALLAADVAIRGGDKAGLLLFDDAPRKFLAPVAGRSGARRLARAAFDLEASVAATDYRAAMTFLASQVRVRSLFIVFTNLLEPRAADELAAALRSLMPRHVPLCVLMRDTDVEALAVAPADRAVDLYVRAAAAEALAFRDTLLRGLKKSGVLVLDENPRDITPGLVKRYLEVKARRLI
jgi:hypothetical protein